MENLNEKQIKCVRFWLLRILSENLVESNKINKRIGDLSYQAENLSKMLNSKDQLQVISELNKIWINLVGLILKMVLLKNWRN